MSEVPDQRSAEGKPATLRAGMVSSHISRSELQIVDWRLGTTAEGQYYEYVGLRGSRTLGLSACGAGR